MKADPGNIAANAAASVASPCARVEIFWDTAWVDESSNLVECSGVGNLTMPGEGLLSMGTAPLASCSLTMTNLDGRYSRFRAGSMAALHGIYGKRLRVWLGYRQAGVPQWVTVFTGRIESISEAEASGEVRLGCNDMGSAAQQRKVSSRIQADRRTDEWIASLCAMAGISPTSLQRGMATIPFCYVEDDFALDEIRRVAMSEGGVAFFDTDGTLRFWNLAHWCHQTSVATFNLATFAELEPESDFDDVYNQVAVEYQPRSIGPTTVFYKLERPLLVPPGGSRTITLRFSLPEAQGEGFGIVASSAGGVDLTPNVSVSPLFPQNAQSWTITFSNNHPFIEAIVTVFETWGRPLEGRPSEVYLEDAAGGAVPRRRDVRGNWTIQTEEQARLVAPMLVQRLKDLRPSFTLRDLAGNPLLELGDIVTVTGATRTGIQTRTAIIGSIEWSYRGGYLMNLRLHDFSGFYADDNYFRVGTSALNVARLIY